MNKFDQSSSESDEPEVPEEMNNMEIGQLASA